MPRTKLLDCRHRAKRRKSHPSGRRAPVVLEADRTQEHGLLSEGVELMRVVSILRGEGEEWIFVDG